MKQAMKCNASVCDVVRYFPSILLLLLLLLVLMIMIMEKEEKIGQIYSAHHHHHIAYVRHMHAHIDTESK